MNKLWMSRRRLLLSLAAASVPSALAGFSWMQSSWLRRATVEMLLGNVADAREIGARYLAAVPEDADPARLAAQLFQGMQDVPYAPAEWAALRRRIRERLQQDFASGDTLIVDGWILARTEARLCALALVA